MDLTTRPGKKSKMPAIVRPELVKPESRTHFSPVFMTCNRGLFGQMEHSIGMRLR